MIAEAEYYSQIEARMQVATRPTYQLTGVDFQMACNLHGAAVPLAAVLRGIDRASSKTQIRSLKFCDSFIREEARNMARASVPAASAAPVVAVERSPGVRYSARCSACGDFGTVVLYDGKREPRTMPQILREEAPCTCVNGDMWREIMEAWSK
jgi:hypothetical protein